MVQSLDVLWRWVDLVKIDARSHSNLLDDSGFYYERNTGKNMTYLFHIFMGRKNEQDKNTTCQVKKPFYAEGTWAMGIENYFTFFHASVGKKFLEDTNEEVIMVSSFSK